MAILERGDGKLTELSRCMCKLRLGQSYSAHKLAGRLPRGTELIAIFRESHRSASERGEAPIGVIIIQAIRSRRFA